MKCRPHSSPFLHSFARSEHFELQVRWDGGCEGASTLPTAHAEMPRRSKAHSRVKDERDVEPHAAPSTSQTQKRHVVRTTEAPRTIFGLHVRLQRCDAQAMTHAPMQMTSGRMSVPSRSIAASDLRHLNVENIKSLKLVLQVRPYVDAPYRATRVTDVSCSSRLMQMCGSNNSRPHTSERSTRIVQERYARCTL